MSQEGNPGDSPFNESHLTTPQQRQPYRRQSSWTSQNAQYQHVAIEDDDSNDENDLGERRVQYGLGMSGMPSEPTSSSPRVKRVPVGSRESMSGALFNQVSSETPNSRFSQNTTAQNTPSNIYTGKAVSWATPSQKESFTSISQPYQHMSSETNLLSMVPPCPTRGDLLRGQWSWFSITILTLAAYSTAFSAIYLVIAIVKPRWGERVGTQGHLSFSSATLLSALFAKTIELSFVTVFVALLGQVLSRRAFDSNKSSGGISIAEMNMRCWIMQPGTLVTNWMGVRYAVTTVLGLVVVLAAFAAIFYTTAAEALVAPKLKLGQWETLTLGGRVATEYANINYIMDRCQTPVQKSEDPVNAGSTCLAVELAGQGFHNLQTYLSTWTDAVATGNLSEGTTSFANRPQPVALMYDNTTVQGQWLDIGNITKDSERFKRLVLNVTMAMPHANIFSAARDPTNHILQPEDFQGNGEYLVRAGVPAPALNVICAGISTEEANATFIGNDTSPPPDWPKAGVLEDVFNFTVIGDKPPWFGKLPLPFNTVVNFTKNWGPTSVYLLAAPESPASIPSADDYVLCGFKSMQYADCTTAYHVTISGGMLSVHCGKDPENVMPYRDFDKNASTGGRWEKNWKDVGTAWIDAVALSQGISDANASVARLLTQMIPPYQPDVDTFLPTSKPSIGEGLSVLAGATLLMSSEDTPFIDHWNYSETVPVLMEPQLQYFHSQLRYRDYASGSPQNWQDIFYIILVATFLLNCFALAYLTWHFVLYGQITDFTEPQNLFALAINSPPSRNMAGACGAGPHGRVLAKKWAVNMQPAPSGNPNEHPHFFVQYQDEKDGYSPDLRRRRRTTGFGSMFQAWKELSSPRFYNLQNRGGTTPGRPRSIFQPDGPESPAVDQYKRLSGRV